MVGGEGQSDRRGGKHTGKHSIAIKRCVTD